jgi:SNF2 family DNA or RNA helicase
MKQDRLEGLPDKQVQVLERPMPEGQQEAYLGALQDARSGRTGDALKALQGIRKISLTADPLDGTYPFSEMIDRSARLEAFRDCVRQVAERQEKTLIFVEYRALQPILAAWLQAIFGLDQMPLIINGSVPGGQRQALVDRFQAGKPGFDAMILGPRSAGIGLTLTAANNVIHLTRWWNPAVEDQCTDRVFRIGQNRAVTVWLPQAIHPGRRDQSFDQLLHQLLERKRRLSANALSPPTFSVSEAQELFQKVIEN